VSDIGAGRSASVSDVFILVFLIVLITVRHLTAILADKERIGETQ
jgi:hypothetical protein